MAFFHGCGPWHGVLDISKEGYTRFLRASLMSSVKPQEFLESEEEETLGNVEAGVEDLVSVDDQKEGEKAVKS